MTIVEFQLLKDYSGGYLVHATFDAAEAISIIAPICLPTPEPRPQLLGDTVPYQSSCIWGSYFFSGAEAITYSRIITQIQDRIIKYVMSPIYYFRFTLPTKLPPPKIDPNHYLLNRPPVIINIYK